MVCTSVRAVRVLILQWKEERVSLETQSLAHWLKLSSEWNKICYKDFNKNPFTQIESSFSFFFFLTVKEFDKFDQIISLSRKCEFWEWAICITVAPHLQFWACYMPPSLPTLLLQPIWSHFGWKNTLLQAQKSSQQKGWVLVHSLNRAGWVSCWVSCLAPSGASRAPAQPTLLSGRAQCAKLHTTQMPAASWVLKCKHVCRYIWLQRCGHKIWLSSCLTQSPIRQDGIR